MSFSVFSGSLVADNISIADDPAFSPKPFLQAKSLHIGVEVGPLLFHRQLLVTSFVADSPAINLVHNAQGTWNFSDMGRNAGSRTRNTQKESALPTFTVGEMKVVNGTATVSDVPSTGAPITYSKLNLSAEQFSFAKAFSFVISASLPGDGVLDVKGNAGPVNQKDASETPLNATIHLNHFDPVAAGVVQASQGISMLADVTAQVTSNGQTLTSKGTVQAARLKLVANGSPTPNPVKTFLHRQPQPRCQERAGQRPEYQHRWRYRACERHLHDDWARRRCWRSTFLLRTCPSTRSRRCCLPRECACLAAHSLQGGTLTANLAITGPANAPTISGPVQVDNTRLAGFDLSSKIGGSEAGCRLARAARRSRPSGANVNLIVPGHAHRQSLHLGSACSAPLPAPALFPRRAALTFRCWPSSTPAPVWLVRR